MKTALLAGKVAIVTGGGRGLGHAMTLGLARSGASVVISAAREANEIRRSPMRSTACWTLAVCWRCKRT